MSKEIGGHSFGKVVEGLVKFALLLLSGSTARLFTRSNKSGKASLSNAYRLVLYVTDRRGDTAPQRP